MPDGCVTEEWALANRWRARKRPAPTSAEAGGKGAGQPNATNASQGTFLPDSAEQRGSGGDYSSTLGLPQLERVTAHCLTSSVVASGVRAVA